MTKDATTVLPLANSKNIKQLPFLIILILFSFFSVLNIPVLATLWRHGFDDGTYSHAFLIPFISLYLYFKLSEIGKLQFRDTPNIYINALVILGAFLLFLTSNAQISLGYWLATLFLLIMAMSSIFKLNRYTVFPALYLVFIFPFWGGLTDILQTMSVTAVTLMMGLTGIPTYVEAQYVSIPAGTFEIADGCSGLRYIIVSLAISTLYIFLFIKDTKRAAIFFTAAIIGGLLTNWLRITILILIGHETDMTHSLMYDHNSFGWYIYIPFMILLYILGNKITDSDLLETKDTFSTASNNANLNRLTFTTAIIAFVISSTSFTFLVTKDDVSTRATEFSQTVHPEIYFYSNVEVTSKKTLPEHSLHFQYKFTGKDLDSKPTYFANQFIPKGWQLEKERVTDNWRELWLFKGEKRAFVSYNFQLGEFTTANKKSYKLKRLQTIFSKQQPMLNWLWMPCENNCQREYRKFTHFKNIQ